MDVMVLTWIEDPYVNPSEVQERFPGVPSGHACYPGGLCVSFTPIGGETRTIWVDQQPFRKLIDVSFEHEPDEPAE